MSLCVSAYLEAGEVSVLGRYVDRSVPLLVDLVQRDGLLLHELQ